MSNQSQASLIVSRQLPPDLRRIRACTGCKFLNSLDNFNDFGCPNCGPGVPITRTYTGTLAITNPNVSWVAKWKNIPANAAIGLYALEIAAPVAGVRQENEEEDEYYEDDYEDEEEFEAGGRYYSDDDL
ncbi:hypothetical protein H696_01090 [Fonticula alba]|uniref:Spt4/RpoE2 zinc finger domain-containing protein n=1 Tax=Fonticula alba TaxID=691883 RepID=A0A058ZBA0_FONAL|nr:hypothetical protein H696_01090 [Fonticula alba]KCV71674.1 hypothetical protein H696_01090 [Fonticula alba]|eukprot:XP_009493252.1 hypothetical protein H696_01090 [Fonticula alba]